MLKARLSSEPLWSLIFPSWETCGDSKPYFFNLSIQYPRRRTRILTRRQRAMFGHLFVQSDDFRVARQLADRYLYLFAGERRRLATH
jgi:hypothetical protein